MIWADLRILVLDTGRVWWRTLPQLLSVYLLGWLGDQLAQRIAIRVGEWNSWAALAVFSFMHFYSKWDNKKKLRGDYDHLVEGMTEEEANELGEKNPRYLWSI